MLWGALVADAAAMGLHWLYDQDRIAEAAGDAPELLEKASFVGRWMDLLRRGYDRLPQDEDDKTRLGLLEKEAVLVSLENLLTFPFVEEAVDAGRLSIHGLWMDISEGRLEAYDPASGAFHPV